MKESHPRPRSFSLHEKACEHLVGGVNSPVRAFKSVHGSPVYFAQAKGACVTDEDGNEYVDYIQSWGPMIHGHAPENVLDAIRETMEKGTSFGAPHVGEIEMALRIKARFPNIDKVRFVSSGTEAVMSAVRLARGVTGRDGILKFEGCYHGHVDSLLAKAGSGIATLGIAGSPGIPQGTVGDTVILQLNDEEMLEHAFSMHGKTLACVIIEPLPANNGLLPQRPEFLQRIRDLCDEHQVLLIFDEVITGFRFQQGGVSSVLDIQPDITTLGKAIGGGLPVGAYGARDEIMSQLAPEGPVYQAGTLSGNPIAMAAGSAAIDLLDNSCYDKLEALGIHLEDSINQILSKHDFPFNLVRVGSMFWMSPPSDDLIRSAADIPSDSGSRYADLHYGLLDRGHMLAPSAYEIGFLSTAHTRENIDDLCSALDSTLIEMEAKT